MSALERIKDIEWTIERVQNNGGPVLGLDAISFETAEFLFRAYDVMRSIACRYKQDLGVKMDGKDFIVPGWAYLESQIDEEFEQRMAK